MIRRRLFCMFLVLSLAVPAAAEPIRWVDFGIPYESLKYAMEQDMMEKTVTYYEEGGGPGGRMVE